MVELEFQKWYFNAVKTEKGFYKEPLYAVINGLFLDLIYFSEFLDESDGALTEDEIKQRAKEALEKIKNILANNGSESK